MSDFLTHFGVKGMKWGKHKVNQLASLERISVGEGRIGEVIKLSMVASISELRRNDHNLRRVAAGRATVLKAQKARFESGNTTLADKFDVIFNTPISNLFRK